MVTFISLPWSCIVVALTLERWIGLGPLSPKSFIRSELLFVHLLVWQFYAKVGKHHMSSRIPELMDESSSY